MTRVGSTWFRGLAQKDSFYYNRPFLRSPVHGTWAEHGLHKGVREHAAPPNRHLIRERVGRSMRDPEGPIQALWAFVTATLKDERLRRNRWRGVRDDCAPGVPSKGTGPGPPAERHERVSRDQEVQEVPSRATRRRSCITVQAQLRGSRVKLVQELLCQLGQARVGAVTQQTAAEGGLAPTCAGHKGHCHWQAGPPVRVKRKRSARTQSAGRSAVRVADDHRGAARDPGPHAPGVPPGRTGGHSRIGS